MKKKIPKMDKEIPIAWSAQFRKLMQIRSSEIAITDGESISLSFLEIGAKSHALANLLKSQGLTLGTPVASFLPNSSEAVWVGLGLRMSGVCEVALSWNYTDEELNWCAQLSGFQTVISKDEQASRLRSLGWKVITVSEVLNDDPGLALPPVPGSTPARFMFTSGTTGKPKGVLYDHLSRWHGELLQKSEFPFTPKTGDTILLMTPYVHGAGLIATAWMDYGGHVALLNGIDLSKVETWLNSPKLRAIFAPPTVLAKLLSKFEDRQFKNIECIFTGTQPLTPTLYERVEKVFGPVVRITYGKTECVNPITILPPAEIAAGLKAGNDIGGSCVGWPAPGVEIILGHPTEAMPDREIYPPQEVWLRATQMSKGMVTIDGFQPHSPDGWHATGDLGHIDEVGRLHLIGRLADVIKTGGYRVNPDEIESILNGLSECEAISIISIPSDYWGEIIIAVAEGVTGDWEASSRERVEAISNYKRPRIYLDLKRFSRNPQGKVSRRDLRKKVLENYLLLDGPYPNLEVIYLS